MNFTWLEPEQLFLLNSR